MSWRVVLGTILVIAAIVIGGALWRQHGPGSSALEQGRSDYTLHDFELVSLDAEGREAFTLRAPQLTRDPAVRTLDIATPVFVIPVRQGGNGAPWDVRSKTGWVSAAGDEIRLRGDVVATSTDADGQAIRMDTQQLKRIPQSNRATSAVQVVRQAARTYTQRTQHGREARQPRRPAPERQARYEKVALASRRAARSCLSSPRASPMRAPADRRQPIDIEGGSAVYSTDDSRPTVLSGGVTITQGTLRITASTAEITMRGGEAIRAVLRGGPVRMNQQLDDGTPMSSVSNGADYDMKADVVVFSGSVSIQQPRGSLSGDRVTYNMRSGQVASGALRAAAA